MSKAFACLIPSTRDLATVTFADDSACADGWEVMILADVNGHGVHKMRESLLARAMARPATQFIRYLDDDDTLLPHLEAVREAFEDPKVGIVYTDAVLKLPSGDTHEIRYTGDPRGDLMDIHPWSWVARASVLADIKRIFGYVWNYERQYREGGYCWLQFLMANLNIKHIPVLGYQYHKSFDPSCISQQPEFSREAKNLQRELERRFPTP